MGWLHRLLHHDHQLLLQLLQVHLLTHRFTKGGERLGGIISATIGTPVNDGLEATAQRLEEGSNHQSRTDQDEWGLCHLRAKGSEYELRTKYQSSIGEGEDGGKQRIDQRAPDEHIDIEGIGIQRRHQEASNIDATAKEADGIGQQEEQRVCRADGGDESKQDYCYDEDTPTHNQPSGGSSFPGLQETAIPIHQDAENNGKADDIKEIVHLDKEGSGDEEREHPPR